jgi:probable HAF family extracellular repeat protein
MPRYTLTVLGGLGGNPPVGDAAGINDRGWAVGDATLSGDTTEHAALWRNGVITDLATLGGDNSAIGPVATPSESGLIAGWAQTSTSDPLGETWGSNFGCTPTGGACEGWQDQTLGFVWINGRIQALPTLGGNNAMAFGGVNDLGQVVGTAETATVERACRPHHLLDCCVRPQVLDCEAVVWRPRVGEISELPPYPGDLVGLAAAINDEGQVVGQSGSCTTPLAAASNQHAMLWQDGVPSDLGTLGGVTNNAALAINNWGQIVGFSDLPGDSTGHAFIWQHGVMSDIGTLPGAGCPAMCLSSAWGINDAGQVVGQSCDENGDCRAFLWQDGVMRDLNAITDRNTPEGSFDLIGAQGINSRGAIAGEAANPSAGEAVGFTALPCDSSPATDASCSEAAQRTLASAGLKAPGPQTTLAPARRRPRASSFGVLP